VPAFRAGIPSVIRWEWGRRHRYNDDRGRARRGSKEVVIKDAGHIVNMEKPEIFNEVVLSFLRKQSP
jgi:pimeloyl-ACP methyl ester carboxylesterase